MIFWLFQTFSMDGRIWSLWFLCFLWRPSMEKSRTYNNCMVFDDKTTFPMLHPVLGVCSFSDWEKTAQVKSSIVIYLPHADSFTYHKVTSCNTSRWFRSTCSLFQIAHEGDPCKLWPFDEKLIFWLVLHIK